MSQMSPLCHLASYSRWKKRKKSYLGFTSKCGSDAISFANFWKEISLIAILNSKVDVKNDLVLSSVNGILYISRHMVAFSNSKEFLLRTIQSHISKCIQDYILYYNIYNSKLETKE
jgi:hypothetical protein